MIPRPRWLVDKQTNTITTFSESDHFIFGRVFK